MTSRRAFLLGIGAALCAPAVGRAAPAMPRLGGPDFYRDLYDELHHWCVSRLGDGNAEFEAAMAKAKAARWAGYEFAYARWMQAERIIADMPLHAGKPRRSR